MYNSQYLGWTEQSWSLSSFPCVCMLIHVDIILFNLCLEFVIRNNVLQCKLLISLSLTWQSCTLVCSLHSMWWLCICLLAPFTGTQQRSRSWINKRQSLSQQFSLWKYSSHWKLNFHFYRKNHEHVFLYLLWATLETSRDRIALFALKITRRSGLSRSFV